MFAAASLTDSLQEIAAAYEKQSGERIVFNFAASGLLARQIEEGAPADLFISADEARADALETKGLIVKETRQNLLANSLVIVTAPDTATVQSPGDLTNAAVKRVALGDPKTVPAGTYAKVYLEKSGLWPAIEPKVIPCENVRAVLAAVESGNVDAGLVYKTDAAISKKVRVVFEVPVGDRTENYLSGRAREGRTTTGGRKAIPGLSGRQRSGRGFYPSWVCCFIRRREMID